MRGGGGSGRMIFGGTRGREGRFAVGGLAALWVRPGACDDPYYVAIARMNDYALCRILFFPPSPGGRLLHPVAGLYLGPCGGTHAYETLPRRVPSARSRRVREVATVAALHKRRGVGWDEDSRP